MSSVVETFRPHDKQKMEQKEDEHIICIADLSCHKKYMLI